MSFISDGFEWLIDRITPQRNLMPKIIGGFAKDVASFFITYRFLNMLGIVNVFNFLWLFYSQLYG